MQSHNQLLLSCIDRVVYDWSQVSGVAMAINRMKYDRTGKQECEFLLKQIESVRDRAIGLRNFDWLRFGIEGCQLANTIDKILHDSFAVKIWLVGSMNNANC